MHKCFGTDWPDFAIRKEPRDRQRAEHLLQRFNVVIRFAEHAGAASHAAHQQRAVNLRLAGSRVFPAQQCFQIRRGGRAIP